MTRFTPSVHSSLAALRRTGLKIALSGSLALSIAAALPSLVPAIAGAQVTTTNGGSIQGTITDASGAAIPNAQISIVGTETGYKKAVTADSSGYYVVGPLTPGSYKETVNAAGFQNLSVTTVVRTGTVTSGTFKLTVGASTETVEVDAGSIQVNTDQAGVSDVLTAQQIDTLPINGRNFLDVAQIEPGVILQAGGSFDPTKSGYSALSISGVSGRTTRILLDGQDITDETVGTTIFNVSQGAIGEFQLNRSTQDVSGDVTSTGQVLVVTKAGTNRPHGEVFYNFQDSRALFATEFGTQPAFQRNQFGGSVGGPIIKDKLFFFGNAERIKQDAGTPAAIGSRFPQFQGLSIASPYRETYSTLRLDYNGPLGGRYFVRGSYNVNSLAGNFGSGFELYANRDNTPGIAGGADFQSGKFTHSFRVSYEKFHNLISDISGTSPLNILPGIAFQNTSQTLYTGPNVNAPQGTFQSDKQGRYDGSFTKGTHTVRYGYSMNYILGGGFANFFGLGPRIRETNATQLANCGNVVGAAACPSDPLNGYKPSSIIISNGLGYFTERPGFGLIGSGVHDWRQGAYVADSWKATPSLTFTAGLRWSVDTQRANQDLAALPCSSVTIADPTQLPCTGSTPLFSAFRSDLGASVHQPYGNFAPQLGLAYSPGDHKTVLRAGIGVFFEGDVFNNTTNARTSLLANGPFFAYANPNGSICGGTSYSNPDGSQVTSATVNGQTLSLAQICQSSIAVAAPYVSLLNKNFQALSAANPSGPNSNFVGSTLNATGIYGAPYRTPYAQQWNFGLQRELFRGGVLSVDYVHNSTLKIAQQQDVNHVGAARYLNATAARNAVSDTLVACSTASVTVTSVNQALAACPGLHAPTATNPGGGPAKITDFANNGLDSGNQYLGGTSAGASGLTVNTGAAFPGANPLVGNGAFLLPIGRSGYDALQVVFREQIAHTVPGIERSNLQVSYNLSKIVSSADPTNASDQFFSSAGWDNDNPSTYIGRAGLDRKHQLSFGGSFLFKYGPQMGLIGHFYSALPQNLTLDTGAFPTAQIFTSDVTGDGTSGDLAPGTLPGAYMHDVKPSTLGAYINNFNDTQAGKLTPAGQALVNAGIFTPAQLTALNGVVQRLTPLPQQVAPANPSYRQVDANFSYPIRIARYVHALGESAMLEPKIAFYNVGNFSNFGGGSGNPSVAPFSGNLGSAGAGSLNGPNTFADVNPYRVTRQSGTYNQGSPRTTEFQLRLVF